MAKDSIRSTAYHAGRQCDEPQLLEPSPGCPICGFEGEREQVLRIQNSPNIVLLQCPECHAISASRMPRPETLAEYYASYRQDTDLKVTFFSPARFAEHILKLAGTRWNRPDVRILDFGGGDGSLSIALAERLLAFRDGTGGASTEIDVIDYSQQPAEPPDASISIRQLNSLDEASKESYDLVIASSVIEHIPDPVPGFRALFAAMRAGGRFYARTPWIVPVLRILGHLGLRFDFTYPAHVHDLGKNFWENLTGRLDVDQSRIRLRHSQPSIVETRFTQAPLRTLAAYVLKAPWQFMPESYSLVGGWEVMFERAE